MIWEMILEKYAILLIEVLRKKRYKNQKWRKAYEINNIRNRKCNGK